MGGMHIGFGHGEHICLARRLAELRLPMA